MAEYIDKENALLQLTGRFPHSMSLEKYIGLVNFRINGLPPADVVEREKIDKAIEDIKNINHYYKSGEEVKAEVLVILKLFLKEI